MTRDRASKVKLTSAEYLRSIDHRFNMVDFQRIHAIADEIERLTKALRNIATNKLTSTTALGPLYRAGVSAGLAIAAGMAREALEGTADKTSNSGGQPVAGSRRIES